MNSKAELLAIYLPVGLNSSNQSFSTNTDLAKYILKSENKILNKSNGGYSSYNVNAKEILRNIEEKIEYQERLTLINGKQIQKKYRIRDENKFLYEKINRISLKKFSELINGNESRFDKMKEKFKEDTSEFKAIAEDHYIGLIYFLIKDGYINENYREYMGYFYPNSLSWDDRIFVRNFLSGEKTDQNYKINKLAEVVREINNPIRFSSKSALNFSLLDYLLGVDYKKAEMTIRYIFEKGEYEFLNMFFEIYNKDQSFVEIFIKEELDNFLTDIFTNNEISETVKARFLVNYILKSEKLENEALIEYLRNHFEVYEFLKEENFEQFNKKLVELNCIMKLN